MAKKKTAKKTPAKSKKKKPAPKESAENVTPSTGADTTTTKPAIEEPKPGFEDALEKVDAELRGEAGEQPKKDGRGGARPGAGRPRGTDDLSRVNQLPEKANLTLVPILQIPFKGWAKGAEIPALELSKQEAEDLALPVTQLLEFYFPGKVPEIAWVWLMAVGTIFNVVDKRMDVVKDHKKTEKGSPSVASKGSGPEPFSSAPDPHPSGPAQPASEYPKDPKK